MRRICWPNPDATCLAGGCIHCNGAQFQYVKQIIAYANTAGMLPHRAQGQEDARAALRYGFAHNFFNVETR